MNSEIYNKKIFMQLLCKLLKDNIKKKVQAKSLEVIDLSYEYIGWYKLWKRKYIIVKKVFM